MRTPKNRVSAVLAMTSAMFALASVFTPGSALAAPAGPVTVQLQQHTVQLGHLVQLKTVQLNRSTVQLKQQTVQLGRHNVRFSPRTVQLGRDGARTDRQTVQLSTVQLKQQTVQLKQQTVQLSTVQLKQQTVQLGRTPRPTTVQL